LQATNKSSINSDIYSDSEGNESKPSYNDLAYAVENLGALLDEIKRLRDMMF
jgi:hypothetical protein